MAKHVNDDYWEKILKDHDALSKIKKEGVFIITSNELNKYRESRLLTKFDFSVNLPKIFIENNLNILPITRGSYIIGNFNAYQRITERSTDIIKIGFPENIESVDYSNIYSESAALNCAYISGIIDNLINEKCYPTVSGRMSTKQFNFQIQNKLKRTPYSIEVKDSQCEIDGGYESRNNLLLIEAKKDVVDDFLIRQLYYPYRLWKNKIRKNIIPVYLTYCEEVFSFYICKFQQLDNYNSLEIIDTKRYKIATEKITKEDIHKLLQKIKVVDINKDKKAPFPQADAFNKIYNLMENLKSNNLTSNDITSYFNFDPRQADYYANASKYLGLIDSFETEEDSYYYLTEEGKRIMNSNLKERKLGIARHILEHKVFNEAFQYTLSKGGILNTTKAIQIMESYDLGLSPVTIKRRASTVVKWTKWIQDLAE